MALTERQKKIINIIELEESASISAIARLLGEQVSTPTLNRDLAALASAGFLQKTGKGRATAYRLAASYTLLKPADMAAYFAQEPDTRRAMTQFNHALFPLLEKTSLFSADEKKLLEALRREYQANIKDFPPALYRKELERLTIELSWKSSQIEGNTYSLLETERLFTENEEAAGKPKEDAVMLLNHKKAMGYLLAHEDIAEKLSVRLLEELHSLIIEGLGAGRNIRSRTVGITGTAYKPLDNAFQIRESLEKMCAVINAKDNGFEKALLAIALISYIQPFEDGNKRTGRITGNALLIAAGACPLSYRSVDSLDYKKAMLLFYEQNNLSAFKDLFIEQIEFSVRNYFR